MLDDQNLMLNEERCIFAASGELTMGFHLTTKGLAPPWINTLPSRTACIILEMPHTTCICSPQQTPPQTLQHCCKPTSTGMNRTWTTAFLQLRSQLIFPPVTAHFDLLNPTFATCDCSTVMSQCQNGAVVASRSLAEAEQKNIVGEREVLDWLSLQTLLLSRWGGESSDSQEQAEVAFSSRDEDLRSLSVGDMLFGWLSHSLMRFSVTQVKENLG